MAIALQDTLFKLSRYRTDSVTVVVTRLRYGSTRVRIPNGTRNFFLLHNVYTGSRVLWTSYSVGTDVLCRGYSNQRVKLITHLHLLRMLRMSGAMPLLPVCAFGVLIWTVLRLPQSLMLPCQWSATKMDTDALGDGFKKGSLSAWRVLCAFGKIRW
jgi:hypothetical protein